MNSIPLFKICKTVKESFPPDKAMPILSLSSIHKMVSFNTTSKNKFIFINKFNKKL